MRSATSCGALRVGPRSTPAQPRRPAAVARAAAARWGSGGTTTAAKRSTAPRDSRTNRGGRPNTHPLHTRKCNAPLNLEVRTYHARFEVEMRHNAPNKREHVMCVSNSRCGTSRTAASFTRAAAAVTAAAIKTRTLRCTSTRAPRSSAPSRRCASAGRRPRRSLVRGRARSAAAAGAGNTFQRFGFRWPTAHTRTHSRAQYATH